ncbi:threonine-phosphate decarboxylase [Bradyrhizobium sp. U87765 SZCCT0131]|uniref:threonine-phosphate decarboxylase CobD n=1 Tax=unclassified Bradyrhizobium TaxID=2631580 RepID=UPI001BAD72EC|nr:MULTISPECIES: threonine-phosphate decarboxylase CobD [unclassified Bradyrhizobium]MBR1217472.1 threonine-phosphate decarboxylase [Bradyrhizobium sp. U87765 SZCCT0131]MBR1264931.1 threonine-phosphate decarboxylase [Bradyrhizobium sp. U87765 SZCCT0134]MBR1304913.1 threonine-phosphate decarboxylase [Bradyrhizobium sp. U87765 SZCCT0110]MBR1320699.1 threonine-phosphate decarboxylase [Bradyrhizobium sp. U87765 SZCCT0109]MBR1349119.1 threonine-phosphate decarboxylase [Bradyrhizobium sp. U87765 SZC
MKHGGDLGEAMARYGGDAAAWLDLSTGINPHAWPMSAALAGDVWRRLPSRGDGAALLAAARAAYGVPAAVDIVAAPGTQALIQWLPHLAAGGAVAVIGHTYNEHAPAWRRAGHEVVAVDDLATAAAHARHIVIVNPNNPDGRVVGHDVLRQAAGHVQRNGGWLVVDEAFVDVDPGLTAAALCDELPVVILRSFGKFYGLAGLRLGFAIAAPPIAAVLAEALGPWCCSGPALAIGAAALADHGWAAQMREQLTVMANALDRALVQSGFAIVGGTTLFRLARHRDAAAIHDRLARHHIWCRRFDEAPDLLRFGLPPDGAARERLIAALRSG